MASTDSADSPTLTRGPSPDHGFVLVSDSEHHDAPTAKPSTPADSPVSRTLSPAPGDTLPSWLLRGAEGLRAGPFGSPTAEAGGPLAAPGSAARLAQENAQLRDQLLELAHQHEWALNSVVSSKDREIADLSSRLRRMSNSFNRQSLDVATFHRDMMQGLPDSASPSQPDIVPISFSRLPSMLASKTVEVGAVPTTKVALDALGLPKYVCLDWDTPQDEAEQPPLNDPPARSSGARLPRLPDPRAALARLGRRLASVGHQAGRAGQTAGHAAGRLPARALASRPSLSVRRCAAQVPQQATGALGAAARSVSSAGHSVGGLAGRHLGGVGSAAGGAHAWLGSAAGRSRAWLSTPAVASNLELALGLALMGLTGVTVLRTVRSVGHVGRAGKLGKETRHRRTLKHMPGAEDGAEEASQKPGADHTPPCDCTSPYCPDHLDDEEEAEHAAASRRLLFPLDLTLPTITLPPFPELPTVEFLDADGEGDDVRVLHVDGHAVKLPGFFRLL